MITLYHGSNLEIDKIRLDLCKPEIPLNYPLLIFKSPS